ncbi:hypothetical protein Ancab_022184 [Ancistrocladus abbreviatus]
MPLSPIPSPCQAYGNDSKLQSISPALISSEQRRLTENLNGEATKIDAIEGSIGLSSMAIVDCVVGDEEHMSDGGPMYVVKNRSELEAGEDLGLVFGPSMLQVENWTGLGKNVYQNSEAVESETNPSLSEQLSPNCSSRIKEARILSKSGGSLSKSKAQKQKKAS